MNTTKRLYARQGGFTLIELMVVVAIVAIIAAIAYPSYVKVVDKSSRSVAKAALADAAAREQAYFTQYKQYAKYLNGLGYPGSVVYIKSNGGISTNPSDGVYKLSVDSNSTNTQYFKIVANAIGRQARDTECTSFYITSTGQRGASGTAADSCW